jgi:membrane protein required for colicin V production
MNAADLAILGAIGLVGLIGLKTGLLKPASGIGGIVLGIIAAIHFSGDVAVLMEEYIDGAGLRRVVAFVGIVVVVTVGVRVMTALVKKLLSVLLLGWVDHLAGAVGGTALGVLLAGTSVYLLTGADLSPTRDALAESKLAPGISRASLVKSARPWCSSFADPAEAEAASCTDVKGLFTRLWGDQVSTKVTDMLAQQDLGGLSDTVQQVLTGSPNDIANLVSSKDTVEPPTEQVSDPTEEVR